MLLAKVLDLNETQTAVLSLVFRFCDDRDLPLLDLADVRTTLRFLTSDEGKPVGSGDTATNTISGTSMATPHVPGVVATYLQTNPTATPALVASTITSSATQGVVKSPGSGSPNRLLFSGFTASPPPPPPPPPRLLRPNRGRSR